MFTLPAHVPLELSWLLYLANVAAASLLVCGLALLVQRCWPNRTLPLRHLILLGGLLVTLAVPLVVGLSYAAGWSLIEISGPPSETVAEVTPLPAEPAVNLERRISQVPASYTERPIAREDELGGDLAAGPLAGPVEPGNHEAAGPAVPAVERALDGPAEPASLARGILWTGTLLAVAWLVGSLWQACRFARGLIQVRSFLGTLTPIDDPRLLRIAADAAGAVGLRRCPPLARSAAVDSPVSVGVLRGRVVLPAAQLSEWSDEAWRSLLLHEMAHLRRRDLLVGFLQRLALVLYWWNPLLRFVSARIAVLREQICDDLVTQHGAREDRYAALIVDLAGRMVARQSVGPVLAAADGTPGELASRIRRLLDPQRKLATKLSRTMKLTVAAVCAAMVVGVGSISVRWVAAEEQPPAEPKNPTTNSVSIENTAQAVAKVLTEAAANPTLHKKVLVVDMQDKPVVGAKVTPWAIRSALGHGFKANQPPPVATGADGIATIPFPQYVNAGEKIPVLQLTCRVEHPDFAATSYNDVPVTPGEVDKQSTIKLAPGVRIEVTPIAEGIALERDRLFALWSSPVTSTDIREAGADNRITLPRLPAGKELLRVAYLPKKGPAMFSDVLSQKTEDGESYSLSAPLKPAIQVTGELDESVPRPVENGIVVAEVIEINEGEPARSGSVDWRVWSRIEKDGSFLLDNVPAGQLQVIALCDGFIAESGSPPAFVDERERKISKSYTYPQVFTVNQTNHTIRLAMTKTAECIVRVVDPQGHPIEGAKCVAGPNVKWWGGGSQIYAHPLYATSERLTSSIESLGTSRIKEPTPFQATTDAQGIARIKNLPLQEDDFVVGHEKFEAPINGNRRYQSMELSLDRPCEVTVTMQPKGTQRIGDLPAELLEECATPAAKTKAAAPAVKPEVKYDKPEVKADKPAAPAAVEVQAEPTELSGVVVDEQGQPLADVKVDAWTWRPGNETKTDKDGRFVLKGFKPESSVQVEFAKPGFSPALFVAARPGTRDWTVVLTQGTWVEGWVFDKQGVVLPKAIIRAGRGPKDSSGRAMPLVWTSTRSDAEGRYRLDLEPDDYVLQVQSAGGPPIRQRSVSLSLHEKKKLNLRLGASTTFRGVVRDSTTGEPVEGITLWNPRSPDIEGVSNRDGQIEIPGMLPGELVFSVKRRGVGPAGEYARWWSPVAGNEHERADFRDNYIRGNFGGLTFNLEGAEFYADIFVEPAVSVSGRVFDPDGQPVGGATVSLLGHGFNSSGPPRFVYRTDELGRFEASYPASHGSSYRLVVHEGALGQWHRWANGIGEEIKTVPGERIEGIELKLSRGGTVRGRVLDKEGRPRPLAHVRTLFPDDRDTGLLSPTTQADIEGRYELRQVAQGEQRIVADYVAIDPVDRGWSPKYEQQIRDLMKDRSKTVLVQPDAVIENVDFSY